jgi:hypothetical protein
VRPLGIATRAVHLVGVCADGSIWVQQRSEDKANNPGMWDTLMGGMVSAADGLAEALARETWEGRSACGRTRRASARRKCDVRKTQRRSRGTGLYGRAHRLVLGPGARCAAACESGWRGTAFRAAGADEVRAGCCRAFHPEASLVLAAYMGW